MTNPLLELNDKKENKDLAMVEKNTLYNEGSHEH